MIPESTKAQPTSRPKSTLAQTVTATLTAVLLVVFLVAMATGWALLSAFERTVAGQDDAPSAVTQWLCLPYTDFVLDQNGAGLTPEQIAAVLKVSEYGERGQLGVTTPDAAITEPSIDSPEACGYPFEILDAAGLLGAPSGPANP